MNLLKTFYYNACSLLPMQFLKIIGSPTTLLPYHHTVSKEALPHIRYLYRYKNETQFIKDLDFLLKHYQPATPSAVIQSVNTHKKMPGQSFLLSFDDGFREVHDIIAPILEKKGVPAIFFINPAFIDNKDLFYRCKISLLIGELLKNSNQPGYLQVFYDTLCPENKSLTGIIHFLKKINQTNAYQLDELATRIGFSFDLFLQKQQPFLSSEQLQSLHKRGFTIGAHSMDHPYYHLLPLNEQMDQTVSSCNYVNQQLGTEECCFSFPHTDHSVSRELFTQLNKTRIPLFFGIQNQKIEIDNKVLHRFNAERPEVSLETQVKGLTLMMWMRHLTGKNHVNRN